MPVALASFERASFRGCRERSITDFSLAEEHRLIRKAARASAERQIVPYGQEHDRAQEFDRSLLQAQYALGYRRDRPLRRELRAYDQAD